MKRGQTFIVFRCDFCEATKHQFTKKKTTTEQNNGRVMNVEWVRVRKREITRSEMARIENMRIAHH